MQWWATDKKVLVCWDSGDGPPLAEDGSLPYHHFVVQRGLPGGGVSVITRTTAMAYLDEAVVPGGIYQYVVHGADDAESDLTEVARLTVTAAVTAAPDLRKPTVPSLWAESATGGIRWRWDPSVKPVASDLLGYTLHDADEDQIVHFLREVEGPTTEWTEAVDGSGSRTYALRGIDRYLNQSDLSAVVTASAGPLTQYIGRWNLILNPRVHDALVYNATNWYDGSDGATTRTASAPDTLPVIADMCIRAQNSDNVDGASAYTAVATDLTAALQAAIGLGGGSTVIGYLAWSWYGCANDDVWQSQLVQWSSVDGGHYIVQEWRHHAEDNLWHENAATIPLYADLAALRFALTTETRGTRSIASSATGNPTMITTATPINLQTGDTHSVTISSHVGSTPDINGSHAATITGLYTFTIPVNVTTGGTGGSVNFGTSPSPTGVAYVTGVMVEPMVREETLPYGDGDTEGWSWTGDSHGSVSVLRSTRWNGVRNPAAGGTEAWDGSSLEVVATIPGVALPTGATACFHVGPDSGGAYLDYYDALGAHPLPPGVAPGDTMSWQMQVYVGGGVDDADCYLDIDVSWWDIDGGLVQTDGLVNDVAVTESLPASGFECFSGTVEVPAAAALMEFWVTCNEVAAGGADAAEIYVTQVMAEKGGSVPAYCDGDTTGWVWANGDHTGMSCLNEGTGA